MANVHLKNKNMFGNNKDKERIANLEEMVVQLINAVNTQAEQLEELKINKNPKYVFRGFGHTNE